jgi:cell division septation protein DedD
MLEERRQFPRLVPSTPLFVSMDDAKSGLLLDLCEGGLAVASLVPRNLDDVFSLAFDLPEGVGHIETKAQVAWTRDSGHLTGVRFMDLDEVSQQQLSEWIAAGTNLRPAGSEEIDEPIIVTRSTYAQVDAIRRQVRHETRPELWPDMQVEAAPQVEAPAVENKSEEPAPVTEMAMESVAQAEPIEIAEKPAAAMDVSGTEMTRTLFPETNEEAEVEPQEIEQPVTARMSFTDMAAAELAAADSAEVEEEIEEEEVEVEEEEEVEEFEAQESAEAETASVSGDETLAVPEMGMAGPAATMEATSTGYHAEAEPTTPGSTSRAEWVEHMAQMGDVPVEVRLDAGSQALPPDAETVGWASDAVGWVQEIAEKRVTAPEEAEFDGIFFPEVEMAARAPRPTKSRHTIELVLAVVLLTWALVFLGYQMGSTGANQATRAVSLPKSVGGSNPVNAGSKIEPSKAGASLVAPATSAEAFPEMSPVPPINAGRRMAPPSSTATLETPPPATSHSGPVAIPKTVAPAPSETTRAVAETTVLAGGSPSMNSGVVLQVGAMKMEGNATALMQDLKKKKFSAFVYRHGNDNLYRVGVGPFGDKDASAKVKSELQKNGYTSITAKWTKDKG